MAKNKHNLESGSSIERSDERIKETQEVFTPPELVDSMVSDIPEDVLKILRVHSLILLQVVGIF